LPKLLLAGACALALSGCDRDSAPSLAAAQPRGATVAFESIDGLPSGQFQKLVHDLNDEVQARRLAVTSREQPSAYRVRGYLAANVEDGRTTISWVWDVFGNDEQRALRISGVETAKNGTAWSAADDSMLQKIARESMDQLTAFLTSPGVTPGAVPADAPQIAFAGTQDSSPEAAGIFRLTPTNADPIATGASSAPATAGTGAVPLPRRRPTPAAVVSVRSALTLSAKSR
jgi:hypothetical protein